MVSQGEGGTTLREATTHLLVSLGHLASSWVWQGDAEGLRAREGPRGCVDSSPEQQSWRVTGALSQKAWWGCGQQGAHPHAISWPDIRHQGGHSPPTLGPMTASCPAR